MGYRCFTIHYFFKIIGAEKFKDCNDKGYVYTELKFEKANILDSVETEEAYIENGNMLAEKLAGSYNIPKENVILITKEEYEENTENGEELGHRSFDLKNGTIKEEGNI
jgi:hypothetical protein